MLLVHSTFVFFFARVVVGIADSLDDGIGVYLYTIISARQKENGLQLSTAAGWQFGSTGAILAREVLTYMTS